MGHSIRRAEIKYFSILPVALLKSIEKDLPFYFQGKPLSILNPRSTEKKARGSWIRFPWPKSN